MVNFTVGHVRALMSSPEQIRNMCVIAHVDHGKSTLSDSLVAAAGIMKSADAGQRRVLDDRDDEITRGITIKATAISMHYAVSKTVMPALPDDRRDFLVNLIDSPGHVDFSSEVTAALRVTDGALVVVDCVDGVCVQTETVLRQALAERIVPVLFINKVDRAILEMRLDAEEAYQSFVRTIQSANAVIATYCDPAMGEQLVDPVRGTVAWGSGYQGWAFSITQFARLYATKFGAPEAKMAERLWGDHFYDAETRKWSRAPTVTEKGGALRRSFCQYCLDPIYQLVEATMSGDDARLAAMMERVGVSLSADESELPAKHKLRAVMSKFLPAADTLLLMIITHLPSPKRAQAYRAEMLYSGPPDDKYYAGIRDCDESAPLMLYVSKMVPAADKRRFFAFGRVFSGTVKTGQKVRIMGNNYVRGEKTDLHDDKPIQRCVIMMGRHREAVEDVPCGNVVGLVGVDKYIVKTATLTGEGEVPHPLKGMKYSVSPVVRVAVEAKNAADLPKLVEGLKWLVNADPLVACTMDESGEHVVAGAGELHLEICLKDLAEDFLGGTVPLKVSEPVVAYRETVTSVSPDVCLAKSTNKHNRLFCRGAPLGEELCVAIEGGQVGADEDAKARARTLAERHGWDGAEARRIWCFGPDGTGPNIVVDATKGVQGNLAELKDSVVAAWQWATKEGAMCGEAMRGVRVNLEDVMMHSDPAHRGGRQIIPAARRVFYACELTAGARLMEPMFLVEIQTVQSAIGGIYSTLSRRRGVIVGEEARPGTPITTVRAYLPVAESFGVTADLRASTGGQAFPQCVFDHWQLFPGDPLEAKSQAAELVRKIRTRKGLKPEMPPLDTFVDKL